MKIEDFEIGKIFKYRYSGIWKCTDIGTRTISAIMIDEKEGVDSLWYQGPPYMVKEFVFDEIEMGFCYLNDDDLAGVIENEINTYHPGFSNEDKRKITEMSAAFRVNLLFDRGVYKKERIGPNGEVYKAISPNVDMNEVFMMDLENKKFIKYNYKINIYEVFTKQYYVMPVKNFLKLRVAVEEDYKVRDSMLKNNT